jgi:hypothetical protein
MHLNQTPSHMNEILKKRFDEVIAFWRPIVSATDHISNPPKAQCLEASWLERFHTMGPSLSRSTDQQVQYARTAYPASLYPSVTI